MLAFNRVGTRKLAELILRVSDMVPVLEDKVDICNKILLSLNTEEDTVFESKCLNCNNSLLFDIFQRIADNQIADVRYIRIEDITGYKYLFVARLNTLMFRKVEVKNASSKWQYVNEQSQRFFNVLHDYDEFVKM